MLVYDMELRSGMYMYACMYGLQKALDTVEYSIILKQDFSAMLFLLERSCVIQVGSRFQLCCYLRSLVHPHQLHVSGTIPSFYKNFTFLQVELEAVKSPFQSPSFVIYHLMCMHKISLASDPNKRSDCVRNSNRGL